MLAFQATRQDGNSVVRFLDEKSRVRGTHQYQPIQLIRERKAEKCRGVDTEKIDWIADRAYRGQVERSVGEFLTNETAVAQRSRSMARRSGNFGDLIGSAGSTSRRTQKISGLVADRCPVIVFGGRLQLHLRGVRKVSVAGVHEVRGAAHEAQFHAEQIGAIVQIGMVHALILRLLFRLQLRLSEGVVPRPCECDDGADSNCDFQQHFHECMCSRLE